MDLKPYRKTILKAIKNFTIAPASFFEDPKWNDIARYCKTSMSFGASTEYNTVDVSKKILNRNSEECNCASSRIAPYNEQNLDSSKNTNLCFNKVCKHSGYRDKLVMDKIGSLEGCSKYCSNIYQWLDEETYMKHANEISIPLFKELCGEFKPLHPLFNKKIAIIGAILTLLFAVLLGIISKIKNYTGSVTSILIIGVIIISGLIFAYLSWELSGQNLLAKDKEKGSYHNVCKSRKLNITLPSDFCPPDLGAECMSDQDCKKTNCNNKCINQLCIPGDGQERKVFNKIIKHFPSEWFILSLALFIMLPIIIVQSLKLTKMNKFNNLYVYSIFFVIFFVLCFVPILIISLKGKPISFYSKKCSPKVDGMSLLESKPVPKVNDLSLLKSGMCSSSSCKTYL